MGLLDLLFGKKEKKEKVEKESYEELFRREAATVVFKATHKWESTSGLTEEEIIEFFHDILTTEFPEYTIKTKVPVTELVGDANDSFKLYKTRPYQAYKAEWGAPYTFVMYQDNIAKAIVMIGTKSNHANNVKYLIARMYAKKLNLPYIKFHTHLHNNIAYVILRINKILNE